MKKILIAFLEKFFTNIYFRISFYIFLFILYILAMKYIPSYKQWNPDYVVIQNQEVK